MSSTKNIVFLYSGSHVPDVIIEQAKSKVPDGFSLIFCENGTPDSERRAALADADYVMAYAVGFEDFDVAGRARLFQLLSAGYDRFDLAAFAELGLGIAAFRRHVPGSIHDMHVRGLKMLRQPARLNHSIGVFVVHRKRLLTCLQKLNFRAFLRRRRRVGEPCRDGQAPGADRKGGG